MRTLSLKRLLDLILASSLLILTLPLWVGIGVLILIQDGRPVFFSQLRAGQGGQPFRILKFRTLPIGPHDPTRPDLHATPVGRFLRAYGLDEIPQLWNVLHGDMSLIGPRPALLSEVPLYDDEQRQRLAVRPGLTGWAQIHGRNALSWEQRVQHDVWYIHHHTLKLDLIILLRTPVVLYNGDGVYGLGNYDPGLQDASTQEPKPGTV